MSNHGSQRHSKHSLPEKPLSTMDLPPNMLHESYTELKQIRANWGKYDQTSFPEIETPKQQKALQP